VAIDELTYPAPNLQRAGPGPSTPAPAVEAAATGAPTTRVFPFTISSADATRNSRSSVRIYGPAIISGWSLTRGGAATGQAGIGLGKSASAISEVNVAQTVAPPFTMLLEAMPLVAPAPITRDNVTNVLDQQANILVNDPKLGIIVLDPEFFLVVYVSSLGGGIRVYSGYVTVLERVSAQALANFL
jgi:hypothetical protein